MLLARQVAAYEQANRQEQQEYEEQIDQLTRLLEGELALPSLPAAGHNRTSTASETEFRKRLNTAAFSEDVDKAEIQLHAERAQNFEEAFNKVTAYRNCYSCLFSLFS
jgi:hypothetical protein